MTSNTAADRLLPLLHQALGEADTHGETLVAALLAQCIDSIERRSDDDGLNAH